MDKPKKAVVDCSTGVTTIVELTDEEIAEMAEMTAKAQERQALEDAASAAKAEAKASAEAKLAALGLTAEEIAAL